MALAHHEGVPPDPSGKTRGTDGIFQTSKQLSPPRTGFGPSLGPVGPPGADGLPGAEGPKGDAGPVGPRGPAWPTAGPLGPAGPPGLAGPAGAQGLAGVQGPPGGPTLAPLAISEIDSISGTSLKAGLLHPGAQLYADDDEGEPALYARLNVSDVGSLHEIRDRALASEFEATVSQALHSQPLLASATTAVDGAGEATPAPKHLTMRVDLTQFAERYEASALSLTQLTPHQTDALHKTRGKKNVNMRASAGTGKTYAAAHAILALVGAGRRVGVLANSHKAILNLMGKAAGGKALRPSALV